MPFRISRLGGTSLRRSFITNVYWAVMGAAVIPAGRTGGYSAEPPPERRSARLLAGLGGLGELGLERVGRRRRGLARGRGGGRRLGELLGGGAGQRLGRRRHGRLGRGVARRP